MWENEKKITVTEIIISELTGNKIAKYLLSIGECKETNTIKNIDVKTNGLKDEKKLLKMN
ncbi:hypothetical protein NDK43_04030 [Neobacillus pocheonensis]|uniref:Uncharacterized protein n=1 Tax=Neobacillus pocheonensis TaxID=363869 RepID=A0ABT0W6K9_9BACI|nr:hypothetical protein [Neobacillus pocheonensis]